MNLFRNDNTDGYTQTQLDALNNEWDKYVQKNALKKGSDEYYQAEHQFTDKVASK